MALDSSTGSGAGSAQTEATDPVTHAALGAALETDRAYLDADLVAFGVDPMDGIQVDLLNIPSLQPVRSDDEADALVARWRRCRPRSMPPSRTCVAVPRAGAISVAMLCTKVREQLDELLARPDAEWPLMEPAAERPELRDRLLPLVRDEIRPAFVRYREVVVDEISPRARSDEQPGLAHLPGGREIYASLARAHTSLETEAEEVHRIGLEEIARIDDELVELGATHPGNDRARRHPVRAP